MSDYKSSRIFLSCEEFEGDDVLFYYSTIP